MRTWCRKPSLLRSVCWCGGTACLPQSVVLWCAGVHTWCLLFDVPAKWPSMYLLHAWFLPMLMLALYASCTPAQKPARPFRTLTRFSIRTHKAKLLATQMRTCPHGHVHWPAWQYSCSLALHAKACRGVWPGPCHTRSTPSHMATWHARTARDAHRPPSSPTAAPWRYIT